MRKALLIIWVLLILAVILSVLIGAWWINRDMTLLWFIGFVMLLGIFLLRNLLFDSEEKKRKSKKEKNIKELLKTFCSIQKINYVLAKQDLRHCNKIQFNFRSRKLTDRKKATLFAKIELWKQENLVVMELYEGPLTNGYLELAEGIQELGVSVILYCYNKDGEPITIFNSRTPPKK